MNAEAFAHDLSVSQFVRVEHKARKAGKTVEQYLSSFLADKVGHTLSVDQKSEGILLSKVG